MASEVQVCNRALELLGTSARISSLNDNSRNARAMNLVFQDLRDKLLRDHPWNFAIKRAQLAASATAPAFGPARTFPLPSDFIRLLPTDPTCNRNNSDWQIESTGITTNDSAPLNVRYVYRVTDPNLMDELFLELWAHEIAFVTCNEIAGSNQKKESLRADANDVIARAKKANGFENVAQQPPDDPWVTARI